ncbi:uncharacterized protein LOC129941599 [Eupeodes corollae]|uniref:uncharacterized protein LOC129941599 n=1 Tax=Eupeodes corollae TaxID=290404 RepID=UPI00249230D7|nr:uncharacterized protein LOC129941599 [Eupeodes corollae]
MNEMTDLPHDLLSFKTDFDDIIVTATEAESEMTDQAVNYLLDEIIKKKKELHDPRHRCNRFFGEIRDLLIAQCGLFFSIRTLERKYHYLKRHFDTLCQNNSRASADWPYFDKMMEIFAEELHIEDAPTMASLYPALPLPKSALPMTQGAREDNGKLAGDSPQQEDAKPSMESQEEEVKETTWNHAVVLDFLKICVQKKDRFWDPAHRRRDIFIDIQNEMQAKGYTFKLAALDRKLKNLKTCYHISAQSVRKKTTIRNGRTRWPYFEELDKLYNGFKESKVARKKSGRKASKMDNTVVRRRCRRQRFSTTKVEPPEETSNLDGNPTSTAKYRPIRCKPEPIEHYHVPAPDAYESDNNRRDSFSPGDFDSLIEDDETRTEEDLGTEADQSTKTTTTANDIADDLEFAQRMLALEERRTIATEQLLLQLKESNRLRQKKIEFNRKKLSYLIARAKRKEF